MRALTIWLVALAATFANLPAKGANDPVPAIVSIDVRMQPGAPLRFHGLNRVASLSDGTVAVAGRLDDRGYFVVLSPSNEVVSAVQVAHINIEHIVASADPGFLIAGTISVSSLSPVTGVDSGDWPLMIRMDRRGAIVAATILTSKNPTTLVGIAETPDGGILATGNVVRPRLRSYRDRAENRRFDPVIIKITRAGSVAWTTLLVQDNAGDTGGIAAHGTVVTREGRLFLAGADTLVHLDSDGDLLWARRFDVSGRVNLSTRGVAYIGNDVIVGGRASRPGRAGLDAWAMSVRKDGTLHWAKFIDAGPSDRIENIAGSDAGTLVLAGITRRMGASLEDVVQREDGWLVDLDDTGRVRRSLAVGGDGDDYLSAAAVIGKGATSVGTAMIDGRQASILVRVGLPLLGAADAPSCQLAKPLPAAVVPAPIVLSPVHVRIQRQAVESWPFHPTMKPLRVTVTVLCGG